MASGDAATQWVDLLVRMHEGDAEARHLVEKRREEFCSEFIRRDEAAHFIESIDLVPSTTAKEFHPSEISHKGTMLLQLMQLGYPVPDFCILTTHSFQQPQQQRIELLRQGVANLEQMTGELLGDPHNPLIFAMRCAMPRYIPGMMPTYLNIGVTDVVVAGLAELWALLRLRRFISTICKHCINCSTQTPRWKMFLQMMRRLNGFSGTKER